MPMSPEQLKLVQEMMKIASGSLTLKDFETKLGVLIDFVKKLGAGNQTFVANLERKYQETVSKLSDNKDELEQAKKDAMKYCMAEMAKMHKGMEEKMEEMEDKMDEGMQDPEEVAQNAANLTLEQVKPLLPTLEQLENRIPELGEKIVDSINLLPTDNDEDKIGQEHIKGLVDEIKELRRLLTQNNTSLGGSGVIGIRSTKHSLSSQLDGATLTFSLPAFLKIGHIASSSFPYSAFEPDTDYTADASNHTITFSSIHLSGPLLAGQTLIIELIN